MPPPSDPADWRARYERALDEAQHAVTAADRAAALLDAGDLLRGPGGDPIEAAGLYLRAVGEAPGSPERPLSRLAALARDTGDVRITARLVAGLSRAGRWDDVVTVLVRQAEAVDDLAERAGLIVEAARTAAQRLGDAERARALLLAAAQVCAEPGGDGGVPAVADALEAQVAEHPDDEALSVALARLETQAQRPAQAIEVLVRAAQHVPDVRRRASLRLDAAILCADRAGRPTEALVHLYEAYALDPDQARAVDVRLEAIAERWGGHAEVADMLVDIYERLQRPDRVHAVLERRLPDVAPAERPALLLRLGEHAEYQLLDAPRAFEWYRQGLEAAQGDAAAACAAGMRRVGAEGVPGALETMVASFGRLGLWRALVHAFDDEAALRVEDTERADLFFRAGEVLETHLEDLEGAMKHYLRAFKLQPRNSRYLAAGERLYRRRGDWPMVDRLLGLQVRVASDGPTRARLLLEQGRVRHRDLGRPLDAYDALRAAAAEPDGGESALAGLGDLVRDDEAFAAVERGLRRRAADEGQTEATRLLSELAALYLDLRGDATRAATVLQEASRLAPADEGLYGRALEVLTLAGATDARLRWLASAGARPFAAPRRAALLRAAAEGYAEVGPPAAELGAWRALLAVDPADADALAQALDAAERADDPASAAHLLGEALAGRLGGGSVDEAARRAQWAALGAARRKLGDAAGAAECDRRLLADEPLHAEALPRLIDWYTHNESWEALRSLLETAADAEAAAQGRPAVERLKALATLAEERLGDPRSAAVYLRPLLDVPAEAEAARVALHRLYGATGDRDGEIGLLELELRAADAPETRRALAERLASLADTEPPAPAAKTLALQTLAALAPDEPAPRERLLEHLRAVGDVEGLDEALAAAWRASPGEAALPALRERARLLADLLDRPAEAIALWRAALEHAPDDDEALTRLQTARAAAGDHEAVWTLLGRRAVARGAGEGAARLWREAAVVAEVQLGDPARAVEAWRAVRAAAPGDAEAPGELLRLLAEAEDWAAFAALAEAQLEAGAGDERVELARQLARALDGPLGRAADAAAVWQVVLDGAPADPEALAARVRAAEAAGDDAAAADLLARLAQVAPTAEQAALWSRRAAVLEAAGDRAAALDAWRKAHEAAPDQRAPLTSLRRLALERGDFWTAARALVAELPFAADDAEALELDRMLGRLSDAELGDQLGAVAAWERVRGRRPDDLEALQALKTLYADLGRVDHLIGVLRDLLAAAPDDRARIAQLIDAGRLLEAQRADHAEAFECWWRAWRLSEGDAPEVLDALRRLAERGGLWDRYLDALVDAERRAGDRGRRVALLVEQAQVVADHLGDIARAVGVARSALRLAPEEGPALALLERLAPQVGAWAPLVESWRAVADGQRTGDRRGALLLQAARAAETRLADPDLSFELFAEASAAGAEGADDDLVRLAAAHDRWAQLIEVFTRRWQALTQTKAQLAVLHRLAELLETRAGDWERAFEQYVLALQLEPRDEATRAAVFRLADAHDAWSIVERVFELKARDAEAPWKAIALLQDLATLQAERFGAPQRAFETLRRAFAIESWNEKTHLALRAVAERIGAWRDLARFFEEEGGWAAEQHARLRLYREAADLFRAHGEATEAARVLRKVAELAPDDAAVVDERLGLLRAGEAPAALAEALERAVRDADAERRAVWLRELADLYAGPLADPAAEARALDRLLALLPADDALFDRLAAALTAAGDHRALDQRLARRAQHHEARLKAARGRDDGGAEAAIASEALHATLQRRAELLEGHLQQPREAFRLRARVAADTPDDLDLLFRLADDADAAEGHAELLACAERSAQVADPDHLFAVLLLVGRTARDRFRNVRKALGALTRALDLRPDDVALAREVADLLERRQRHGELLALHERVGPALVARVGEDADAPAVRARWAVAVADLQSERLYRHADAVATLRRVAAAADAHPVALRRLRALAVKAEDAAAVCEATVALAERTHGAPRVELLEAGARDVQRLGDDDAAVALWRRVLALDPDHPEASAGLRRVAEKRQDWDLLVEQHAARAAGAATDAERVAAWVALGRLHQERRADPAAAEAAWRQVLATEPEHLDALEACLTLAHARGDGPTVDALLVRLGAGLDATRDERVLTRLSPFVAGLQLDRARAAQAAGDDDAALARLEDAHRRAPARHDVGQALADLLYARGDLRAAARLYATLPFPLAPAEAEAADAKADEHLRRARAFRAAGEDADAMRHFEAAAQHPAARVGALEALANMQEGAGRWEAAVRLRDKLARAVAEPRRKAASWAAAGLIAEERLEKPARALTLYDKALEAGLDDPVLLRRLLDAYAAHGRVETALALADRLVGAETDPNQQAELWTARGGVLAAAARPVEAVAAYRAALDRSPLLAAAAVGLFEVLDAADEGVRAQVVEQVRGGVRQATGRPRVPVLEALGAWLMRSGSAADALATYEELHALDPDHLGARAALAALYGRLADAGGAAGDPEALAQAILHRAAYLAASPGEPDALRDLVALHEAAGEPNAAHAPLSLLALMGEATDAERARMAALRDVFGGAAPGALPASVRERLVADDAHRSPAGVLLEHLHGWLAPALDAMYRAARQTGGEPADVVHPPVAELTDQLARALELPPRRLWLTTAEDRVIGLARLHPPELVAGGALTHGEDPHPRRFLLGRALELSRGAAVHAAFLPEPESRALFAAAMALGLPDEGPDYALATGADSDRIEAWAELLVDHLDGPQLDTLAGRARPVLGAGPRAFDDWVFRVRCGAHRTGYVLSGHLASAIDLLRRETPALHGLAPRGPRGLAELVRRSPAIADLHRFALGGGMRAVRAALSI